MKLTDEQRALLTRHGYTPDADDLWCFAPEKGHKVPTMTALRWAASDEEPLGTPPPAPSRAPSTTGTATDPLPWELVAMHDPAGRRGVWYRESHALPGDPLTPRVIEVCAGREGDDEYVRITAGVPLSHADLRRLAGCFRLGAMMAIDGDVQAPEPCRRRSGP